MSVLSNTKEEGRINPENSLSDPLAELHVS